MKYQSFAPLVLTGLVFLFGCASEPKTNQAAPTVQKPSATPVSTVDTGPTISKEISLFDGKTLTGWASTEFGGNGEVSVEDGAIRVDMGADLSGVHFTNTSILPHTNYEIELDAKKLDGSDFFCGLTFPIGTNFCSFIVGGWGGGIVGISSIDGMDASENETSKTRYFERDRWFHIRVQVTQDKLKAWIDGDKLVDVESKGRKIAVRAGGIERSIPFGIATWQTSALYKNIKLKPVIAEPTTPAPVK